MGGYARKHFKIREYVVVEIDPGGYLDQGQAVFIRLEHRAFSDEVNLLPARQTPQPVVCALFQRADEPSMVAFLLNLNAAVADRRNQPASGERSKKTDRLGVLSDVDESP